MDKTPNKNTNWKVKNLNGTTGLRCGCGSWITHWRNYAHSSRATCAVIGCSDEAKVGAHVLSTDRRTDSNWWIAPFCATHNNYRFKDEIFLKSDIVLVSANKNYTCK